MTQKNLGFACEQAEGFSGADLAALLREAGLDVLRQLKTRELIVGKGAYTEQGKSSSRHDPRVNFELLFSKPIAKTEAPIHACTGVGLQLLCCS